MDAVILAAGKGSRMGNVTKTLLEVGGETLLHRLLRQTQDLDNIILVIGDNDRFKIIEETLDFPNIMVIPGDPDSMVRSLLEAESFIKGDFIMLMGDCYFEEEAIQDVIMNVEGNSILQPTPVPYPISGIVGWNKYTFHIIKDLLIQDPNMTDTKLMIRMISMDYPLKKITTWGRVVNINTPEALEWARR